MRRPTELELERVPWWLLLDDAQRARVAVDMEVAEAEPGEFLCRIGRPATLWFGVVEGLFASDLSYLQALYERLNGDDADAEVSPFGNGFDGGDDLHALVGADVAGGVDR